MMVVSICVGSSCHLKGSYDVIELMKTNIALHNLEEKVALKAAFCLGKCTDGVSIKIDDTIVCGVSKENFNEIFDKYILANIK